MAIEVENNAPGPSTQRSVKRKFSPGPSNGEPSVQRMRLAEGSSNSSLSSITHLHRNTPVQSRRRLPRHILLLLLPQLLSHPPSHPWYPTSLLLSLSALRKCLALNGLTPDVECRACLMFAETGIKIVREGLQGRSPEGGNSASLGKNIRIENEGRVTPVSC